MPRNVAGRWPKSTKERHLVRKLIQQKGRCAGCQAIFLRISPGKWSCTNGPATWDHINPRSRGGNERWDNLMVLCRNCNTLKGNRCASQEWLKRAGVIC